MAATIAEVITRSRELLSDTTQPYRYSDVRLIGIVNASFRETKRIRPDLLLSQSFVTPEFVEADATGVTAFPIDDQYMNAIINFVVGYTELSDDEFTVDGRANTMMLTFRSQLTGA